MTADRGQRGPLTAIAAAMRTLPDVRAALEAVGLFLLMIGAGALALAGGALTINPLPREQLMAISIMAFVVPALGEEIIFRGWLDRGAPLAAAGSLLAFVAWHPLQTLLGLPYGRPEFMEPTFLALVALLGSICTVSRLRSGSIWPAVVIHWGTVVAWLGIFGG